MKLLIRLGLAALVLILLLLGGAFFFIDSLVKGGIEKGTTYATGTETKLGSVDAGLFKGHFAMKDLSIANPAGFRDEPFLSLGAAEATWDNGTILSDDIAIGTFALDGVTVNLESTGGKTNYGAIIDHLNQLSGPDKKPPEPSSSKKSLTIKRIEIKNIKAGLHLSGVPLASGSMNVEVPLVAVDDFHSSGTTTEITSKLTRALVDAILQGALKAGQGVFPADLLKDLNGNLNSLKGGLEAQAKEILKGIETGNLKGVDDALKNAGDLFKGKKK